MLKLDLFLFKQVTILVVSEDVCCKEEEGDEGEVAGHVGLQ